MSTMGVAERFGVAIRRSLAYLPADAAGKVQSLLTPTALSAVAATLVAWAGSHAVGVGEAVDILVLGVGLAFVGMDAFDVVRHVGRFAELSINAGFDHDLDLAAREFALAVSIIGVDALIVLVTHGAVKSYRGRYRPTIEGDPAMPAGEGLTNKYGDITYSSAGTETDKALVLHHEKVHSLLSPKLMLLRELRADIGIHGYSKSSLLRYIEEALAESYRRCACTGSKGCRRAYGSLSPTGTSRCEPS